MLHLTPKKEFLFTSNTLNIHRVTKIQISHKPSYTQMEIIGENGLTLRVFHKSEADIPFNIIVVETPPPAPVEEFPAYPLT